MPEIETDRAVLFDRELQGYRGYADCQKKSAGFKHILENLPITIRDEELIVGSATKAPERMSGVPGIFI